MSQHLTEVSISRHRRTFEEFASVDLARSDLDGNDVALHAVSAAKSPCGLVDIRLPR
jgi:hypothetical protein